MEKKFDIIVVDPPWQLKKLTHKARSKQIGFPYKCMDVQSIKKLPIDLISHDKSILFLWTTQKYLFESKIILEAWGFNHFLTMVWEKIYGKSSGMPLFGFRWNAEFILVGTKRKLNIWPKQKLIPCVFQAPNIGHSCKPDYFYDMIYPLGKSHVDIFARKKREKWDAWGDEVESSLDFTVLAKNPNVLDRP